MTPMSNEEAPKHKVRADPHRIMSWMDTVLWRRPAQVILAAVVFLFLALLLGPRLWSRESIADKLKVGERAEGNIKATRSFNYYPSEEKLEKERAEAAAKTLPVFNYQSDMGAVILARINSAFNLMVATDAKVKPKGPNEEFPGEILQDRREQFANALQTEVLPENYFLLKKSNFSAEIRSSLISLVNSAMSQKIVSHRGVLVSFENVPVMVRYLVGGTSGSGREEKINNIYKMKDLQHVQMEIEQQSAVHAVKLSPALAKVVVHLAESLVVPNLSLDQKESENRREAARNSIHARPVPQVKGQVIIADGDPITKEHLSIIRAMESAQKGVDVVQVLLGIVLSILIVLIILFWYAHNQFKRFIRRPRDLLAMSVLLVGLLALAKFAVSQGAGLAPGRELPLILYAIPVAGGAMLVRLLISSEAAALFAMALAMMCGMVADQNLGMMTFYLVTGLVGAAGVTQVQSRSTILRSGLLAGLAGAMMVLGFQMFREHLLSMDSLYGFLAALAGGVLAAFVTLALLPAMEWLFAYTTDVTLLELANLNHPLLRELILRAPGTYHHSMIVGSLSETACERIGANGLLARVACYYHDIGKMKNADYFAENFRSGDNPHNRLKPSMSALIIRSHVKDTIEMLREHRVPELVIETATQHHGKTLIEFFYHKAIEASETPEDIHNEDYRYPGPKPQTREAGVIMLADGVEAAARSLAEPTEDRLTGVVQRVINTKFTDGQLNHCDLTLRNLHDIARSFLQVLRGIYHQRPTYPWQQGKREEGRRIDDSGKTDHRGKGESTGGNTKEIKAERGKGARHKGEKERPEAKADRGKGAKQQKSERERQETKADKKSKERSVGGKKRDHEHDKKSVELEEQPDGTDVESEPTGEGPGQDLVDSGSAAETPQESNPDIKRLGLS